MQGERCPVGGQLQQLGVPRPEGAPAQRADVQYPDDAATDQQRHAEQGLDTPVDQERVPHRGVINCGEDDRLAELRDAAGEAGAERDPHALPDLFLDAARSGRHQLPGRAVEQQHGRGVRLEHLLHALDQGLEQRLLVESGQRGVRHRLDVAQPVDRHPLGVPVPGKEERLHRTQLPPLTLPNLTSSIAQHRRQDDIIRVVTELSVFVSQADGEGGSRTVLRLVGEADVTTQELGDVLAAEAAKKPRLLLVDLSGLTFIDSAALHEVVRAHRRLRADGCRLALVSPSPGVARVLQLSALDQVIAVHASVAEAGVQ
jgi:anti-anti-sigma factor